MEREMNIHLLKEQCVSKTERSIECLKWSLYTLTHLLGLGFLIHKIAVIIFIILCQYNDKTEYKVFSSVPAL